MSKVELRNVCKAFDSDQVIHDVSLDIQSGELVVFVGPSGCGKSTLLRLICGLEYLTGGEVLIDGRSMRGVNPSRREVAMVFQSYALYPHMNVAENMGFALRMSGIGKAERAERVRAAAQTLRLEEFLDRMPRQLSGGQRQRVAIGRAIVREPKVFLFDEPLSNLDAELRVQMRLEIASLHQQLKATMIYVTHDQVEAMTMADRIVVLREGRIEQVGTPVELYRCPANVFVAGFIGSPRMNLLMGKVMASTEAGLDIGLVGGNGTPLRLPATAGPLAAGDPVRVGVRPEGFLEPADGDFRLTADVKFVENLGGTLLLHAPGHPSGTLVIESRAVEPPEPGPVTVGIDPDRVNVFDSRGYALPLKK
ncbi:MAG: sn-glycerol-3-phosphate ABC transporter ATP-binding protein UgpC [Paracoccaceae bacterium]|nr:sn-glycerol-3-phosphate ABC transporter ATP-binding protein UgpC [Paracoccaceae bacterium]MDE2913142.1 sn-glycerol-3-phosphate ABC transporter ATP-binding protein UgpC [Paracoccaceae bacterium]